VGKHPKPSRSFTSKLSLRPPLPPKNGPRPRGSRASKILNPTPIRRPQGWGDRKSQRRPHPKDSFCPIPAVRSHIVEDEAKKYAPVVVQSSSEAILSRKLPLEKLHLGCHRPGHLRGSRSKSWRSFGPGFQRGSMESREITEQNGNDISSTVANSEHPRKCHKSCRPSLKLAVGLNFIRVVGLEPGCGLSYVACRRRMETRSCSSILRMS